MSAWLSPYSSLEIQIATAHLNTSPRNTTILSPKQRSPRRKSNQDVVVKFEHTQYATKNMGKDLLGNSVEDFLVTFGVEEIPVMFQKVVNNDGTKITIIPMSDFIDSQEFIYDTDGKLISYRTISNTVGGNVQYIFSDNILTQTINNMEEFVVPVYEEQDEILVRANKLYNL